MKLYSLLLYASALFYIFLGATVLGKKKRSRLTVIFFWLCFALAYWSVFIGFVFSAPARETAIFLFKMSAPAWALAPALFLHFTLILTGREKIVNNRWMLYFAYLPGLLFAWKEITSYLTMVDLSLESFGWTGLPPPFISGWFLAFNVYYLGCIIFSTVLLAGWGKRANSRRQKKQARIIIITALITVFLIFLNETLLPAAGVTHLPKIPSFMSIVWAYGMWYAISRYRLLELTPAIASEQILASIQDLLILVNPRGEIIHVNKRVEETLGYTADELLHCRVEMLFPEQEAGYLLDNFSQMAAGTKARLEHELMLNSRNNSSVPFRLFLSTVRDRDDDLVGIALVAQDLRETRQLMQEIAERKKMEKALLASNNALKELDQLKSDFLSTCSHELRTPLTSVLGFAKIIQKRFEEVIAPRLNIEDKKLAKAVGQVKSNINIIVSEGERLTDLINNVLDIAKMESGRIEWKEDEINIAEVIHRAVNGVSSLVEQKGLRLTCELKDELPAVSGDRDRLIQVVINLLSNAIKFTETGQITCRARSNGQEIIVSVIDMGAGIAEEDLEKVFDRFKQLGNTLTDKPQGTGLGLSICREIVEHHGGKIWAESNQSQGSTFTFTLPLKT